MFLWFQNSMHSTHPTQTAKAIAPAVMATSPHSKGRFPACAALYSATGTLNTTISAAPCKARLCLRLKEVRLSPSVILCHLKT